jgi:hypothetical protein
MSKEQKWAGTWSLADKGRLEDPEVHDTPAVTSPKNNGGAFPFQMVALHVSEYMALDRKTGLQLIPQNL